MSEIYHDVMQAMNEVNTLFTHGVLGLAERAQAERIYLACCVLYAPGPQAGTP